jgi:hypothetical protein
MVARATHLVARASGTTPNITGVDVINTFIYGTTCEALIHVLDRETSSTTWELLDVTTQ